MDYGYGGCVSFFPIINEETKLKAAIIGLHGDASNWFEEENKRRRWQDLKTTMVRCFDSSPLTPWMEHPTPVGPDVSANGGSKSGGGIEGLGAASSSFDGGGSTDKKVEKQVNWEITKREVCKKAGSLGRYGRYHQRWWKPEEIQERERDEVQELKKNHDVGGQAGWLDPYLGLGVGTGCGSGGGPGNSGLNCLNWRQEVRKIGLDGGIADKGGYWRADLVGGSQGDYAVGYIDGRGNFEEREGGAHGEFFEQGGGCGSGFGGGPGVTDSWEETLKKGEMSGVRGALAGGFTRRGGTTVDGDLSCSERCFKGTFQKIQDREVKREECRGSLEKKTKQYNKGKIVKDLEDESSNNSKAILEQDTCEGGAKCDIMPKNGPTYYEPTLSCDENESIKLFPNQSIYQAKTYQPHVLEKSKHNQPILFNSKAPNVPNNFNGHPSNSILPSPTPIFKPEPPTQLTTPPICQPNTSTLLHSSITYLTKLSPVSPCSNQILPTSCHFHVDITLIVPQVNLRSLAGAYFAQQWQLGVKHDIDYHSKGTPKAGDSALVTTHLEDKVGL